MKKINFSDAIVIIGLIGLVILFFWNAVTIKGVFFFDDIVSIHYPQRYFASHMLSQGKVPLWVPEIFGGFPLLAEEQTGIFYPVNLILFSILPIHIAFTYSIVINFFLGGLFTYMFCRSIGQERFPSSMSGVIFMFSGYLVAHLANVSVLNSIIWLPLELFFVEKYFRKGDLSYAVFAGMVICVQFFGGHPEFTIYSVLAAVVYYIFRAIAERGDFGTRKLILAILPLFLIIIVGLSLSSIQLIPTYELSKLSPRSGGVSYEYATANSFRPYNFITYIFPYIFGASDIDKILLEGKSLYWGSRHNFWEQCSYIGIFPLFLAIVAAFFHRNRYTLFFSGLFVFSVLLALGNFTPLYKIMHYLPVFKSFRIPAKFLFIATFSLSVLAGQGIGFLLKEVEIRHVIKIKRILATLTVLSILGVVFVNMAVYVGEDYIIGFVKDFIKTRIYIEGLSPNPLGYYYAKIDMLWPGLQHSISIFNPDIYTNIIILLLGTALIISTAKGKLKAFTFSLLTALLVLIDLFHFGVRYNQTIDPNIVLSTPDSVRVIRNDKSLFRIFALPDVKQFPKYTGKNPPDSYVNPSPELRRFLLPNWHMVYNISSIDGANLLVNNRNVNILDILQKSLPQPSGLLNFLNVKYLLTTKHISGSDFQLVYADKDLNIYKNLNFLPRAFLVHKAEVIKDDSVIISRLISKEWNPQKTIILEDDPRIKLDGNGTVDGQGVWMGSTAEIIKYTPLEVIVQANLGRSGLLVLSDTYYPGWKVYVNGEISRILRANYAFRAVELKRGSHTVKFSYEPLSFKIGLYVSLLSLIGIVMFIGYRGYIYHRLLRRRRKGECIKASVMSSLK